MKSNPPSSQQYTISNLSINLLSRRHPIMPFEHLTMERLMNDLLQYFNPMMTMMRFKVSDILEYQISKLQEGMEDCRDIPKFLIYHEPDEEMEYPL